MENQGHSGLLCQYQTETTTPTNSWGSLFEESRRKGVQAGWRVLTHLKKTKIIKAISNPPQRVTAVRSKHGCCHMPRCTLTPISLPHYSAVPHLLICSNPNYANESTLPSTVKLEYVGNAFKRVGGIPVQVLNSPADGKQVKKDAASVVVLTSK